MHPGKMRHSVKHTPKTRIAARFVNGLCVVE
jgi:hypothetical protein